MEPINGTETERHVSDGEVDLRHKEYLEEVEDLYNNAPCGYHSLASDGSFLRINDTELRWLGYDRSEMIGRMNFSDILTPVSLNTFQENFPGFKARGWVKDLEFELIRKDGTILPVILSATAVTDSDGAYVMSRSTVFDITERKRVEKELQRHREHLEQLVEERTENLSRSEKRFRTMFEKHDAVMLLIEPETGAIVDANVAASNYYGYSCDDLRRLNLQDIKPLSQQAILDETRLAMNEKQNYFVVLHRLSSGEIRTVEVHISPVDMNDSILLFSIIHDITDRKNAEKKLLESEEKFRLAISTSPDAISIANFKDGLFVEINDAFCDLFGYSREEVLNSTSSELKLWSNPQDRSQLVGIVTEHGFCRNLEAIFRRKDGRLVTCLISAGLMEQNGVSQLISITRDITSRVLAFKEKQELQKQLFESQKMSALGTLVGGIAHDFNNMLQSIMGYSEILIMDKVPGSAGYRELETIIQTSRGGADLVKKLLAFAEQAPGYPTKIEVNHIISELKPLITHTLSSAINIETDLTENPTTILADPSHLEQIVMNVVINASEAMPNGGRVRIATRQKTLDEAYCKTHRGVKPGKYIRLSISDNGHGMDSDTLARIFEPFFSTKQRGSLRGTGMGLSVVKGIAQQYGGHITCDSETGKGTAVRVYFPALDAPAPAPKSALSPKQKESSGFILLVEDNNLQARIESRFLESVGFRVIVAPTGEEALKIFEKQKDEISLVILDLILPGISGKDCLVEFIRMQPTVKVIVASGFTPDDQQSQELNPYIKGFLRKPFNAAQLIEKSMAALEDV